jgi:hypothetical protein
MIGEGEPPESTVGPGKLNQAKAAVEAAAQTVRETTQSIAHAVERGRQSSATPLDRLSGWAREAPLRALTVAFLVGAILGRRR